MGCPLRSSVQLLCLSSWTMSLWNGLTTGKSELQSNRNLLESTQGLYPSWAREVFAARKPSMFSHLRMLSQDP